MCDYSLANFVGIPFLNGGRDFTGCDCWGLVSLAYWHLHDIKLPDYIISCFDTSAIHSQIQESAKAWKKIVRPVAPCLVVMAIDADMPSFCNHVGVYVGNGRFLHTLKKQNSVLERISHPFFKNKIRSFLAYDA